MGKCASPDITYRCSAGMQGCTWLYLQKGHLLGANEQPLQPPGPLTGTRMSLVLFLDPEVSSKRKSLLSMNACISIAQSDDPHRDFLLP